MIQILAAFFLALAGQIAFAKVPFEEAVASFDSREYEKSFVMFKRLADEGEARSQFNVGVMYLRGLGVKQSFSDAFIYLRRAADRGISEAKIRLAILYAEGLGVSADPLLATDLLNEQKRNGSLEAAAILLKYQFKGNGFRADNKEITEQLSTILKTDRTGYDAFKAKSLALELLAHMQGKSVDAIKLENGYVIADPRASSNLPLTDRKRVESLERELRIARDGQREALQTVQAVKTQMAEQIESLKQAQKPQDIQYKKMSVTALVVGNSAYPGSAKLDNPIRDARSVAKKFRDMSFDVIERLNLNRRDFVRALSEFNTKAKDADLSIIFYAGHGVQVFGSNYMLPIDADLTDVAQATLQAISINQVVQDFMGGKIKLVFLDACRDNPLMTTGTRGISRGLAPMAANEGTLISYATKDGGVALDGVNSLNSPYTSALLRYLDEPMDLAVILRKVRESVISETNGKQVPWEYGSLTGGQLVLSRITRK